MGRRVYRLDGMARTALGLRRVLGLLQGDVAEEGVDRRQPSVSAARAVAPFLLQVIEEGDQ